MAINNDGYSGNISLKKVGETIEYGEYETGEIIKCINDPIYFIENYIKIVHVDRGLIPFDMWDFQKELVKNIHNNRYSISKLSRQVGKTTTSAGYILWSILFQDNYSVAILANKGSLAREILDKIKYFYECVPKWLQQGIITWNKGNIELENKSKVFAYATSASGVRGGTFNLLLLDEFGFVQHNMALEFFRSTYPVICSGTTTKVIIVSCVTKDTFILTDNGLKKVEDFIDISKGCQPNIGYEVEPYNIFGMKGINHGNIMVNSGRVPTKIIKTKSSLLECSLEHKLWACKNGVFNWFKVKDLEDNDYISISYGNNIWGNNDNISDYVIYETNKFQNQFRPEDTITKDLAYFLGLYLAEGYSDRNRTIISCGDDVSESLETLQLPFTKYDNIHYTIGSKSLVYFLEYLGFDITTKAKTKTIPKRIMECSKEVICSFLSGFFDGDGCISSRGKISVISASKELIDQIRMLLMNLGMLSQYYTGTTPPTKKVKVSSVYHRLEINSYQDCMRFSDLIGFRLKRKQDRISLIKIPKRNVTKDCIPYGRELLNKTGIKIDENSTFKRTPHISRKKCIETTDKFPDIINKNLVWEKIKISDSENEVYDFSLDHIKDDIWCHSVLYNGIVGHQTPNGLNLFYKMWIDAVEKRSLYSPYEISWDMVPGRDQKWKDAFIRNNGEESWRQEIECEFIGSTATLVSGSKLRSLAFFNPLLSEDGFDMYEQPIPGHLYICTVDCSEGVGQDFSTINVIDVNQAPYRQVAKFRDNTMPLLFFPNTIFSIAMKYNEAFVLVETNNIGQQVIDILHYDLEYDNIYKLEQHSIKGQTISSGFKRSSTIGIRTTKTVKKIGCANLKTLIESDKLIINDFDTIAELNSFVRIRDSYAADEGNNDDLVMGLVIFAWLTAQSYFRDSTNIDIRTILLAEQNLLIEENLSPVGFINNGLDDDFYLDGDDLWSTHYIPNL